jgi:hypothetical protein
VEAVGPDWIVAREIGGRSLDFASGDDVRALVKYRDNPPSGWDACEHAERSHERPAH